MYYESHYIILLLMYMTLKSSWLEATNVADWKATYLYAYVRSLYLYVNLVNC